MLTYRTVRQLFPRARGIADDDIAFRSVFVNPHQKAEKGLFVPLFDDHDALKTAIEHGAIASLWREGTDLPRYVPNHFPIFYVPSALEALAALIQAYQAAPRTKESETTAFYLTLDVSHNAKNRSYDIAVVRKLQQLERIWFGVQQKEGCEPS